MNRKQPIYLTDELERQLMLAAYDEQFRPRVMTALAGWLKRLAAAWFSRDTTEPSLATRSA